MNTSFSNRFVSLFINKLKKKEDKNLIVILHVLNKIIFYHCLYEYFVMAWDTKDDYDLI